MMKSTILNFHIILVMFTLSTSAFRQNVSDVLYPRFNEGTGTTTADLAVPGVGSAPTFTGPVGWETIDPKLGLAAFLKPIGTTGNDRCVTNQPLALSGDWTI